MRAFIFLGLLSISNLLSAQLPQVVSDIDCFYMAIYEMSESPYLFFVEY